MAKEGQGFEQWLRGAKVQPEQLNDQQRAVLQAAFSFLQPSGGDYSSSRIAGYFLLHCNSGLKVAQIARLVGISTRFGLPPSETLRETSGPTDSTALQRPPVREALAAPCRLHCRVSLHPPRGHAGRPARLHRAHVGIPRLQGGPVGVSQEVRLGPWLPGGSPANCFPRGSGRRGGRGARCACAGWARARSARQFFFANTQYAGAFLLWSQVQSWLATARECFSDDYGSLDRGFLTSVFALVVGLERVFHLDQMQDVGFALLTGDARRCPSRYDVALGDGTCCGTRWTVSVTARAPGNYCTGKTCG